MISLVTVALVVLAVAAPVRAGRKIVIEAEDADRLSAPFVIRRNQRCAGGMAVGIPEGSGKPPEVKGSASYRFMLKSDGPYAVWLRKWWMDGCGNSVKLNVDDLPAYVAGEDGTYRYWDWIKLSVDLPLLAGDHTLTLHNHEDGAWIDQIVLTNDLTYVPAGQESSGEAVFKEREIYLTDDFMRARNETGAWMPISGEWKVSALEHPERSANAFQGVASGEGERLTVTGYPFWRDYSIQVAAMSEADTDLGLVLLRSDESNFYLWHIPVADNRSTELIRVTDGTRESLFKSDRHLRRGQWHTLTAVVYRGHILLEIDGNQVAELTDFSNLKGKVGLYSRGEGRTFFDDVCVKSVKLAVDTFDDLTLSAWRVTDNAFRAYTSSETELVDAVVRGGFGAAVDLPSTEGSALLSVGAGSATTGTSYWNEYTLSFDVLPHAPRPWSVLVGITESEPGTAFTFTPSDTGVTVTADGGDLRVEHPCRWTGAWHRVSIDNRNGALRISIDGEVVLGGCWSDTTGRIGFATDGPGVLFDNVSVRTHGRRPPDETITPQFAVEKTMINWASDDYEWEADKKKRRVWNRLDFHGDVRLSYAHDGEIAAGETLWLGISPERGNEQTGCRMAVTRGAVELMLGGDDRMRVEDIDPRVDVASLKRVGATLVASVNGRDVLRRPAGTDKGCHPWVGLGRSVVRTNRISIASDTTLDYLMGQAPCDWRVSNGQFGMTNRWKCDPRWSWFCLMSPAESIMWNKKSFSGDLAMDMWVGMRMELRRRPTYGDPGDMNLTICADGGTLGSGYSFIYGGCDNTATRLLRNDVVVAESTTAVAPSTRHGDGGIHRRWFHLAVKKQDHTIRCFLDEQMILEYEDLEPLDGRRVAAWTFDNGMMMSRIRISADDVGPPEYPLLASVPEPPPPSAIEDGPPASDDSRVWSFETGAGGWIPRYTVDHFTFDWDPEQWEIAEDNAREVSVRTVPRGEDGRCLEITNASGGGTFAVQPPFAGIDLLHHPMVSFEYAIPPNVSVNLYMKVGPTFYSVCLTGHDDSLFGVTSLGNAHLTADGAWHAAWINLRDLFLKLQPQAKRIVIDDSFIGNMDNRAYLVCGIGGNPAGASYRLDNVKVFRAQDDVTAPTAAARPSWDGGNLEIVLDDAGGTGVDPTSIVIRCGDRIYSLDHPALTYDAPEGILAVEPVLAGVTIVDGGKAEVAVMKLADFAGNAIDAPVTCTWQTAHRHDTRSPTDLMLVPPTVHPASTDFEHDLNQWRVLKHAYPVEIERWPYDPAQGRWCLRVLNPRVGGSFACMAADKPYDVLKFPLVSFYYKLREDVDVDLACIVNGRRQVVKFADENPGRQPSIGVPDVVQDGRWHHIVFNLADLLITNDPYAPEYRVSRIEFLDGGWTGNARGAHFYIDDFRIGPVCGSIATSTPWRWSAREPSGIAEAVFRVNEGEWKPIPKAADAWSPGPLRPGVVTVAVKVRDRIGNWSEPVDERIVFDPVPPVLGNTRPANGARTASSEIVVPVTDDLSGIDRSSIRMTVNGKEYSVADRRIVYEHGDRHLAFHAWEGTDGPPFGHDTPVDVAVALKDNAGNEATSRFKWIMDFSRDTSGPQAPYVVPALEDPLFKAGFEAHGDAWRKGFGCVGARFRTEGGRAATGRRCLAVINTYEGDFRLNINAAARMDINAYPLLVFDYRVEGNARFNLYMKIQKGGVFDVELTEPRRAERVERLGRVAIRSDGAWHRAIVDLKALSAGSPGFRSANRAAPTVAEMYIGNAVHTNPRDAKLYLDNIQLARQTPPARELVLEWTDLVDATGIDTYAWCLDRKPDTKPTETLEKITSRRVRIPESGKWYFHVRARDGAGNWGVTSHYEIDRSAQ